MDEPLDALKQQRLAQVLLDFGRAPGKYPVRLGEPRELHAELDTLTVWALGRLPRELEPQAALLREAAVLFIARACFAPEATHYQMLGLAPGACTPEALRARYRNLIRLTHPDMGIKGLPLNAAGAVNRAHGVLSDPDLRRRYDDELADRKAGASAAERDRAARSDSVRRIEHRVTFAERWQSLKARFPNLDRLAAVVGGIVVVAAGLVALALTSQNDDRTLIASRSTDREPDRQIDSKTTDAARKQRAEPALDSSLPTGRSMASSTATPAEVRGTQSPPSPTAKSATVASVAPAPAQATIDPGKSDRGGSDTGKANGEPASPSRAVERAANDMPRTTPLVTDSSARMRTDSAPATVPSGKAAVAEPPVVSRTAATASTTYPAAGTSTPPAAAASPQPTPAEPRRGLPPRSDTESTQITDAATNRASSAPPRQPQSTPAVPGAVQSPATPAPSSPPPPPPPRVVATAPTPPAAPPVTGNTARPAQTVAEASGKVWSVDTTGAMNYLSELISMLEKPNAAYRTNAYLTEMKVKGSLFRPALRLMGDFSEVDVSRVDWSDSAAPGVLKVRGTLVLHGRSSQAPFMRTANFRLTAEFWGTPNGTVLAELNLREAE